MLARAMALVDRWGRRRTMWVTGAARACCAVGFLCCGRVAARGSRSNSLRAPSRRNGEARPAGIADDGHGT